MRARAADNKLDSDKFGDEAGDQTGGLIESCTRFVFDWTGFVRVPNGALSNRVEWGKKKKDDPMTRCGQDERGNSLKRVPSLERGESIAIQLTK